MQLVQSSLITDVNDAGDDKSAVFGLWNVHDADWLCVLLSLLV